MKQVLIFLSKLLISVLFTLLLLEIGLRLFSELIPLDLLIHFDERPRAEIARKRGLPTKKWDTVLLERDDGGPDLRIFNPFTRVTWPIEENGTVSTVVMDEMGFCNPPENGYQLPTIDLITLGDSFTACHAVQPEETWTSQLSSLTGLSAYNLGKGGTGAHEYLQIFKKFGLQKSPQVVIMNVYAGNDFRDAADYYNYLLGQSHKEKNGPATTTPPTDSGSYLKSSYDFLTEELLARHSYTFNLAFAAARYWEDSGFSIARAATDADRPAETDHPPEDSDDRSGSREINFKYQLVFPEDTTILFNPDNTDTDEVKYARRLFNEEIDPGVFWAITEALGMFVELSRQHNFVPIVTYLPSAHTTYAANVVFEDPTLNKLMPWYSHEQRKYLKAKGEQLGYVFIDLTPSLQTAAQANGPQQLLYYRYDLHLTPAGHAIVAEALSQTLQDMDIVVR